MDGYNELTSVAKEALHRVLAKGYSIKEIGPDIVEDEIKHMHIYLRTRDYRKRVADAAWAALKDAGWDGDDLMYD